MKIDKIQFRGFTCFQKEWVDFSDLKPINVIIGRNNTGKSHLLDFVKVLCTSSSLPQGVDLRCRGKFNPESLKNELKQGPQGRAMDLDQLNRFIEKFGNKYVSWEVDKKSNVTISVSDEENSDSEVPSPNSKNYLEFALRQATHKFAGRRFLRLKADRDIIPEQAADQPQLSEDGRGATQIIRNYRLKAGLPRELVVKKLRLAMNEVLGKDGEFLELDVQEYGGEKVPSWGVVFSEKGKTPDLIPLSMSGSGLKTVLLVLLNLVVVPEMEVQGGKKFPKNQIVFAFEELENNLHPALLRRLFQYLLDYVRREKCMLFLTTHSSVALDFFGPCEDAQFIHVTRQNDTSVAKVVNAHFDKLGVLSELGAKPSDLLQANGIIWVEGPSDRIYLNKWISLFSNHELQEGRDYQCAFYGGALLAHVDVKDPAAQVEEMVNLIRVNPNIILVCDSDRMREDQPLKKAVARIEQACASVDCAMNWVLEAKEIENYLPGSILTKVFDKPDLPDPERFERFFASDMEGADSYLENRVGRKTPQKMNLALQACQYMTKKNMSDRFELAEKMKEIVAKIREWNR